MSEKRSVLAEKDCLRRTVLARRAALDEGQREAATTNVLSYLRAFADQFAFRTILGYAAMRAELRLDPWLDELSRRGIGVFLPFVDSDTLGVSRVRSMADDLGPGWRGVREVPGERRRPARIDRIQVFVVPGVAFDASGGRLGYGGGHFDRLLANAAPTATVIGVAFQTQIVPSVPRASHDKRMDYVVTERGWLPTTPSER